MFGVGFPETENSRLGLLHEAAVGAESPGPCSDLHVPSPVRRFWRTWGFLSALIVPCFVFTVGDEGLQQGTRNQKKASDWEMACFTFEKSSLEGLQMAKHKVLQALRSDAFKAGIPELCVTSLGTVARRLIRLVVRNVLSAASPQSSAGSGGSPDTAIYRPVTTGFMS